jgi:hypothetical protein
MGGSVVTFRSQKGPANLNFWETLIWTFRISTTGKGTRRFSSVNRPYRPWGPPAYFTVGTVVLSWAVKGPGFDKPSTRSSAEFKNARSYTSASPYSPSRTEIGEFVTCLWCTHSVMLTGHAWLAVNRT